MNEKTRKTLRILGWVPYNLLFSAMLSVALLFGISALYSFHDSFCRQTTDFESRQAIKNTAKNPALLKDAEFHLDYVPVCYRSPYAELMDFGSKPAALDVAILIPIFGLLVCGALCYSLFKKRLGTKNYYLAFTVFIFGLSGLCALFDIFAILYPVLFNLSPSHHLRILFLGTYVLSIILTLWKGDALVEKMFKKSGKGGFPA